jgi:signal transduction histidine kinase
MDRERLAGEVASTARELGRTQNELRALAASLFTSQEEERLRVARELHDDICQKLAVLEIDTQQIQTRMAGQADQVAHDLEQIRAGIAKLSDEVRRISHALHPTIIEDLGLTPALRSLVEDFREHEQMIVTFTTRNFPETLDPQVATGLYRITQEALRNVSKHAGKTHVKVVLRGSPTGIRLQIEDYGEGFDLHAQRTGLGLINMEERTRLLQGRFTVESEPGEGTRVTIDVPRPQG